MWGGTSVWADLRRGRFWDPQILRTRGQFGMDEGISERSKSNSELVDKPDSRYVGGWRYVWVKTCNAGPACRVRMGDPQARV